MKVLFAVSECVPFVKTGGLADVAGALPKALKKLGADVRVILPNYSLIPEKLRKSFQFQKAIYIQLGWRSQYCGIYSYEHDGITYYFIDNEYYFYRDTLYGHYDDGERFSYFSKAVLECIPHLDFFPDVIHCHDWHTGMVNFLLDAQYRLNPLYRDMKTVFTIHNLQFQGIFPYEVMSELLGLSHQYFNSEQLEFYGNVNFMKGGIVSSDVVTTVSPTYKEEIQYPYFGERLDGFLRKHSDKLIGIVNGIDDVAYNPRADQDISVSYDLNSLDGKAVNKKELQKYFSLPERENTPVMAMVTRLTAQKGLDLVLNVFHSMMQEDVQFIVLGSGDPQYEDFFSRMEQEFPDKVRVYLGFNEALAHQIYAGADLFLMPSQFEPCGLGQLIALQYGTIPIVRETGGLNDTVHSYNESTGEGNGFTFKNFNAHDMLHTVRRANYFYQQKETWNSLVQNAMSQDYSWMQSAKKYNEIYEDLLDDKPIE
ncbi:glycogen synthase GlgA [Paenibacillus sp. BSR1-1]|uniref:glycogen synthase GlgA n=1 Tax=Paenibacillus sp. BSR1-1 TaxID=3020845 RepID=UPI0025B0F213|nr:glycogen synthase GlgA [Paenibacillus sp. BSR1-1]MDN3016917.1 glycogen synthase GlgA [Paenibacillus sp. BSR1-1]